MSGTDRRPPAALVTGWFTFEHGEATAGDLLAGEAAGRWLGEDGWRVDVATSPAFPEGVRWDRVDPADYDLLVFACGPLSGWQVGQLLDRFAGVRRIAVDVSVVDAAMAARFDDVLARDHEGPAQPDISLAVAPPRVPLIGVIHTHPQPAYGEDRAGQAAAAVNDALRGYPAAVLHLDTRIDPTADPLALDARSCAELESVLARLDVLVSARLHGLVLGLRNGVPTVAVDVMPGGGKVTAQARALGWPHVVGVEQLTTEALRDCLDACLEPGAREAVARAAATWESTLDEVRRRFQAAAAGDRERSSA